MSLGGLSQLTPEYHKAVVSLRGLQRATSGGALHSLAKDEPNREEHRRALRMWFTRELTPHPLKPRSELQPQNRVVRTNE